MGPGPRPEEGLQRPPPQQGLPPAGGWGTVGGSSAGVAWPELERPQHRWELPAPAWQRTEEGHHHLVTQEEPAGDPTGRCCHPCSEGRAETQVLLPLGACALTRSPSVPQDYEPALGPARAAPRTQLPGSLVAAPGGPAAPRRLQAAERLWASVPRGTSGLGNERGFVSAVRSLPHGSCILREMNTAPPPPHLIKAKAYLPPSQLPTPAATNSTVSDS